MHNLFRLFQMGRGPLPVLWLAITPPAKLVPAAPALVALAIVPLDAPLVCMVCVLAQVPPPCRQVIHQAVEAPDKGLALSQPDVIHLELGLAHGIPHAPPPADLCLLCHRGLVDALNAIGQVVPATAQLLANARRVRAKVHGAGTDGFDGDVVLQACTPCEGLTRSFGCIQKVQVSQLFTHLIKCLSHVLIVVVLLK